MADLKPKPLLAMTGPRGDDLFEALLAAGVVESREQWELTQRIVIDMQVGEPARVYVQKLADDRFVDVLLHGGFDLKVVDEA